MRKVILQEFISLDGMAAGPNDSVDFIPSATERDQSFGAEQLRLMDSIDTILLGSVTYRLFVAYWPNVTSGEERVFADKLNGTPKIVFSKTLERAPWGKWDDATIVRHDAAGEVTKLKQQRGKDMVMWGSISAAQSLMSEGLIDEYRLVICPVVLGGGKPLFRDHANRVDMKLLEAKRFDRGAVLLKYRAAQTEFAPKEAREMSISAH